MSTTKIEFGVHMTCTSCVEAVKKTLEGQPGVRSVNVDLAKNSVVVDTNLPTLEVQRKLQESGKKVVVKGYEGRSTGVAYLNVGCKGIHGVVRFIQVTPKSCIVDGTVDGLQPGVRYRLSVHECGDLSNGCNGVGLMFNPPRNVNRPPYGDLGNVINPGPTGRANFRFEDPVLNLPEVIGRSLVITDPQDRKLVCGIIARSAGSHESHKTVCHVCDGMMWDEKGHNDNSEALHDFMTEPELLYYFQTGDRGSIPEYEVVFLPPIETSEYNFDAFQRPISLSLHPNENILADDFKSFLRESDFYSTSLPRPENCHFLHKNGGGVTAAISSCNPQFMQGLIFMDNITLEIQPLTPRLQELVPEPLELAQEESSVAKFPHIIKRAVFRADMENDQAFPIAAFPENVRAELDDRRRANHRPVNGLTVELALFFDEAAYKIFAPFFDGDVRKVQDMLLAYVNGVQALYHHPSLGTMLELVLVRLDIMKFQPGAMPHYNGERGQLLNSFCAYQAKINPKDDSDPEHWDMALYVSGLDFYHVENGKKSGVTMGLATVGGVCLSKYDCVIAELGTTNVFGKPYPSAGFTSVYILAHEIGHNLGMHHDGVGNACSKEGYVMSPSRGTSGETQWSTCSAKIMSELSWAKCLQDSAKSPKRLDHSRFNDNPGQIYTAKKQCEILLRDKDAVVSPHQQLSTICYSMQCKTPHRSGYYFAGPALDGTQCGDKKYCYGGGCVNKQPPSPPKTVTGGWGPWKSSTCASGCIEKSQGFQMKRRHCNNPTPVNTDRGCDGSGVDFALCKDTQICSGSKRTPVVDFAAKKCREFASVLSELDGNGGGLQAPHEPARVWMGCSIFCKKANSGLFYTPRLELNDLGISPYFPDGTWCHSERGMNYYCLHHHCLPENFHLTKTSTLQQIGEDVPFSQNAGPSLQLPPEVKSYLSLTPDGKPVKTVLRPEEGARKESDWETDDFVEVPEVQERRNRGKDFFNYF